MGGNVNNRANNITNFGAKPSGIPYSKNFQRITNNAGPSQRSGPNGNIKTNYNFNNNRQQNPTNSTNNNFNHHNNNNKVTNMFGNRFNNNSKLVSPNVKNAISVLNRDNSKDGRFLRNAVQKAMVVEKAAANFVQSGDFGSIMKQTLKRAFETLYCITINLRRWKETPFHLRTIKSLVFTRRPRWDNKLFRAVDIVVRMLSTRMAFVMFSAH